MDEWMNRWINGEQTVQTVPALILTQSHSLPSLPLPPSPFLPNPARSIPHPSTCYVCFVYMCCLGVCVCVCTCINPVLVTFSDTLTLAGGLILDEASL